MASIPSDRDQDIREVLIDAAEVQLAALRAAVTFWAAWAERTSTLVATATRKLEAMRAGEAEPGDVVLEVVDVGRETLRTMTELPQSAASRFIDELGEIATRRKSRASRRPPGPGRTAKAGGRGSGPRARRAGPRRRARVKS